MKELSDNIFAWLYESLSLRTTGLALGILLIALHLVALVKKDAVLAWLKTVPRSINLGSIILTVDFVWALVIASSMDLGEFHRLRWMALWALPAIYVAMIFWVNDYLGARALGILALLAATPLLNAAFLKLPSTRLLIPALAYVWVVLGLFWVGMPHTLRDQIAWASAKDGRFRLLCLAGIVYGILLIGCAVAFYGTLEPA